MRSRLPSPPLRTTEQQAVADALHRRPDGLSINDVRARCGASTSMTCTALKVLESRGEARFDGRRWRPA